MQMQRQMHKKNGFYALNAAFISWMPLWSVICRFQNANTKAKCKCKGKCIGKSFLCPKCGIYLLNSALKRDLSISECKYKGKMERQRQMHRKIGFYALNAAFISWMPLWSVICRFQKANTKAKWKGKGKCIGKSGFYALNAAFISWMPLWSVVCLFQKANTKAKCKCKGKCIGKCFLCPKCGIYRLKSASKRDFSISECKYKGKM